MIPRFVMSTLAAGAIAAVALPSSAAVYYVDASNGNDSSSGLSSAAALQSVSRVNSLSLDPGDSVLFRRNQSFPGALELSSSGSSGLPIKIGAWGSGIGPILVEVRLSGDHIILEDLIVDHQKQPSDAIRIRGGRNCVLRRMTIRNGTRDGVDADGADGLVIEDVEIHHFLNGSLGSGDDSHGIAVTSTAGITVRNANIHHVSGDSLQSDPNRSPGAISNDIVISDSLLWTSPLQEDFNENWHTGDSPGENAIDTKVVTTGFENEIRMNLYLTNVTAYGWTAIPEINNRAAFNLKEKINAVIDRVTVYDSEIAFRIRGGLGNADTTIKNTVIYDVDKAIRSEDGLLNLKVYNTTFGDGIAEHIELAGGSGGNTWEWLNNAFADPKPSVANDSTNVTAAPGDFASSSQRDYRLTAASSLIDRGVVLSDITSDRSGAPRAPPYDSGAFEYADPDSSPPNPPVLWVDP